MPPTNLTTQLRQRADTLEVYLRDRAIAPDSTATLVATSMTVTLGELRDLVRLLHDAADRLSEPSPSERVTEALSSVARPGIAYEVTQRVQDDAQPSTSR